jgi:hypothetical protein
VAIAGSFGVFIAVLRWNELRAEGPGVQACCDEIAQPHKLLSMSQSTP